jgi:hypothetical protein
MKSLLWTICGCVLLALIAAYLGAQEKPAAPGKATEDRQESAGASMAKGPDSEVKRLSQKYRRLDQKAAELARQYRQAQGAVAAEGSSPSEDPASAKVKVALEETVRAAFDARQKVQSYELDQLRRRLAEIEARLTMRERAEGDFVRQRVEELLHPERNWEPRDEARDSLSPVDPEAGAAKTNALSLPRASGYRDEQTQTATDEASKPEAPSDSSRRRSRKLDTVRSSEDDRNPRSALLEAESAMTVARAAITAAEKDCAISRSDLRRTQAMHEEGAVTEKVLRAAEKQISDDETRLEKAKLDLQHAERRAKLARENLETRMKLLELDMADAKLRIEHLADEEARARRLLESKAMSKAQYDESKLALERSKLQLSRLAELMELYAKPVPGKDHPKTDDDDGAVPEPPAKKKGAKAARP